MRVHVNCFSFWIVVPFSSWLGSVQDFWHTIIISILLSVEWLKLHNWLIYLPTICFRISELVSKWMKATKVERNRENPLNDGISRLKKGFQLISRFKESSMHTSEGRRLWIHIYRHEISYEVQERSTPLFYHCQIAQEVSTFRRPSHGG